MGFRSLTACAGITLLMAACSSSSTSISTGSSTSPTGDVETTEAGTSATTAVPTTIAPTTTTPAPIVFDLRGDGIGPFDHGVPPADLIDAISAQFGLPSSDESTEYPSDDGFGGFQTVDGEFGFFARFGRTVCWSIQFCAEFGGGDATALLFAGWSYGEEAGGSLSSTSGVTIGTRWSDAPTMNVHSGGCYTVGSGEIDGIALTLSSVGDPFSSFDDAGNYIEGTPAPQDVTVTYMQAGQVPAFLFGDC